jgi:hypothetical protein
MFLVRVAAIMLALSGMLVAQNLDFSSLDKLASKAKSVNKVSLNRAQLADALSLVSTSNTVDKKDLADLNSTLANMTGIEVRSLEFEKKGQYRDSDLADLRSQISKLKDWSKIIDSKENGEHSEIFMSSVPGNKGLLIVSAEETELSVVLLKGVSSLKEIGGLGGVLGLPSLLSKNDKDDQD